MMQGLIAQALRREDVSSDAMFAVIGHIMDGHATSAQIAGLLVALAAKGETADELSGAARAMRARAVALQCPRPERGIDTCGTGGDNSGSVNISTLAAIIVAACGGVVAKHGNRALSSKSGSADVLEALGVKIDATPSVVERCMSEVGIGFAFAPMFHTATKHAAGPRKELGVRTMFNLLGPLTNPAQVQHQVVGVFDARWCVPMARALGQLGVRRAVVVHGAGSIDEIAVRGVTRAAMFSSDAVIEREFSPNDFGMTDADPSGLLGGDADHNAARLLAVLHGEQISAGELNYSVFSAAVMTAGLALAVIEGDDIASPALSAHTDRAIAAVRDGRAARVLKTWAEVSHG
jgi:anthranilate phosphoribosyltransferase